MAFPTTVYRGVWNPARHDALESRVVADAGALADARADGWRLRPDVDMEPLDGAPTAEPSDAPTAPRASLRPRGRPPKVRPESA
jgi:hypothetical protein